MRIGELAKQSGAGVQALRFYERSGLLPRPSRTRAGYRVYSDADLRRVDLIRQAKRLGFSLDEIKRILRLRQQGACPCGEVIAILDRHLRETDDQIRHLQRFRKEIARTLQEWKREETDGIPGEVICGLIERTIPQKKGQQNPQSKPAVKVKA